MEANLSNNRVTDKKETKRLSKLGEWLKRTDRSVWVINDMNAVLR